MNCRNIYKEACYCYKICEMNSLLSKECYIQAILLELESTAFEASVTFSHFLFCCRPVEIRDTEYQKRFDVVSLIWRHRDFQ